MRGSVKIEDGALRVIGERRRGGAWVARINGTDARYGLAREFAGRKVSVDAGRAVMVVVPLEEVEGSILQIHAGGSAWTHKADTQFYTVSGGELIPLTEAEALGEVK